MLGRPVVLVTPVMLGTLVMLVMLVMLVTPVMPDVLAARVRSTRANRKAVAEAERAIDRNLAPDREA
jgi:hypothetical protein